MGDELRVEQILRASGPLTANEVLSSFIHRLNNFLFIVSGRIEMTSEDLAQKTKTIETIKSQVIKLKDSIEEYEKIKEVCKPELERIKFQNLLNGVLPLFKLKAEKCNVSLVVSDEKLGENIKVDPGHLSFALFHIIDNAIDAAEPKGQVIIKGHAKDKVLNFIVENSTEGNNLPIDENSYEIYKTSKLGRPGLGLGVIKRILRYHDFKFSFTQTEENHLFTILMPIDE